MVVKITALESATPAAKLARPKEAAALPIDAGAISKALERATRPEPVINLITENQPPRPQWARPPQAAKHCNVSLSTFWNWARDEADFPPMRRAGKRCTLIDLNQLDAWLGSREVV